MSGSIFSPDQSAICQGPYFHLTNQQYVRVHIFTSPISNEPTKYLGIKKQHMPRAVIRLVNIYLTVLYKTGRVKMNESLRDMTPNEMLSIIKEINLKKIKQTSNFKWHEFLLKLALNTNLILI